MERLTGLCSLVLLIAAGAYGQGGGNAVLTGTVTDPSGAVIAKADVTITQIGTEEKRTATTNGSGQFTVPSLSPSTYRLTVAAPGFKTYLQDVTLLADQSGSLQIQMQLGASAETLTVDATATLVNTVTPVMSQVMSGLA
ncbi:MAG: carboxypeptidase-like regulatory domain-containing protein [Bryobacteraceae bacterium]